MTIGDDGVASICMGKEHVGSPCENCGLITTPPTTDTVLVSREEAANVVDDWAAQLHENQQPAYLIADVKKLGNIIRALPPYTKEQDDAGC